MRQRVHTPPAPLSWADDRRVRNVAHRGASGDHPENTLAAIRAALALGVDSIELDIQRSRDGALVLIHDTT
jgi:glycerophosphoryl diester phosphodiesterase